MQTTDPKLDVLLAYWRGLCCGHSVPKRSAVQIEATGNLRDHVFIIEHVKNGAARFRHVGIAICDMHTMDLRGMQAHCLFDPKDHDHFNRILRQTSRNPQISRLYLRMNTDRRVTYHAQMVLLPLSDHRGQSTKILGALSCKSVLPQPCALFHITRSHVQVLQTTDNPVAEFALHETAPKFKRGTNRPQRRPPKLHVVK